MTKKCVLNIAKRYNRSKEEIDDIVKALETIKEGEGDVPAKIKAYKEAKLKELQIKTRTKTQDVLARTELFDDFEANWKEKILSGERTAEEFIRSKLVGTDVGGRGANLSVEGIQKFYSSKLFLQLSQDLDGIVDVTAKGELDLDIAEAMENIKKGEDVGRFRGTVVEKAAQAFVNINKSILLNLRKSGIIID